VTRHALTVAAVLVWAVLMAVQVRRHLAPAGLDPSTLPAVAAEHVAPGEEWFGIYQGERKIGWGRRRTRPTSDGVRVVDASRLRLAVLGAPQDVRTRLVADTDDALGLRRFRFQLRAGGHRFGARGRVAGARLVVRYGTGGRPKRLVVPLDGAVRLSTALRPRIAAAAPPPGTRFVDEILSPMTLRHEPVTITVEAHEDVAGAPAVRLREEVAGVASHAWLARDGRVLREEGLLGVTLVAEPRRLARAGLDAAGPPLDLATVARIPVDGDLPAPRETRALTLRLGGDAAGLVPELPPRQRRDGDRLRIVREVVPSGAAALVPAPDATDLAPSPFVASDDPAIVARATSIVGDATDPVARARRLVDWVHAHVTPEPVASVPDARTVLRTLRGDCNEHAVLLAALARAAGIPARVVAGVVWSDGAFLYHAWNVFWLGAWVSADATLGQLPVDATHVALLEGGPERHAALAGVLGRLQLAIEERVP
jgi:hypothetical protein